MLAKTKEVIRKLELGVIELLVGALMVIGIIGYFASVPADLDWIDHTVSFILFSYLFYKLNITSILFGKTSKLANSVIIVSYFSLFFKDIISYTELNAFKFKFITFVNKFYLFFSNNLSLTNLVTFYIGIAGLLVISIYLAKKIEISHPSFLYALYQKQSNASERSELAHNSLKNNVMRLLSIFILLLGFYYFVYNIILEWLEFVIDDPVIATGIIFFIYKTAKHYKKFHADNFIFRIGDFSANLYGRFVSLFHYKKTLPLAISGLLILHALADLGVFAYSLIFYKENFYLEFLKGEHAPFLKLFLEDAKNLPSYSAIPLSIDYLLNAMSLVIFLLIPIIVWVTMFSQKKPHFSRIFLFFIYSSAVAYMLLPGYVIKPLDEPSITGVDIASISLLDGKSALDNFFPDKSTIIVAVSLTSVLFGLIVYISSSNAKIRKELYAISIIGGMTFYTVYIYYFFSSLLAYFYGNISASVFTPNFAIGIVLAIFFILSVIFYIGGYFMFLYEIVMEYHKRKWSEPVDEELVAVIRKIKSFERGVMNPKKAQLIGEVFKYALVGVVSVVVLIAGYQMVNVVKDRACKTELAKFEIDVRGIDKSLRFGAKELQSHNVPCSADQVYFFDLNRNINPEHFKEVPLIMDSLKGGGGSNVFIVKEGNVKRSFYAGNIEMIYPYNICLKPKFDKISFFAEGTGKSAKIAGACGQPECTFIPIGISDEEARIIVREAVQFGCSNCPIYFDKEFEKVRITRQNVEMFRKFTFCDGITTVEILIRPKKGSNLKDFRFYEFIPKSCIDDLNNYLAEEIEGNVEIRGDPLIMWYFGDLGKEKKVSYTLSTDLNDECKQAIKGLGVAQFASGEGLEEEQQTKANTEPTIGGLPDVSVSGIGLKKNVISNLWKYAQDKETNPQRLSFSIVDQTNTGLVECSISNEKHLDCEVKQNKDGFSRITMQIDDFEFQDRTSFDVEVTQFCKKRERKGCVGDAVFWLDSCGNQEEIDKACPTGETCKDGECKKASDDSSKCKDGEKCGLFGKCKNGKCCQIDPLNPFC